MNIEQFDRIIGSKGKYLTLSPDSKKPNAKGKRAYISSDEAIEHVNDGGCLGWEPPVNIVVIDFDSKVDVNKTIKLLNAKKIKKTLVCRTKKGLHLYYQKNNTDNKVEYKQGTNVQLACGMVADIKATRWSAGKYKTTYVVLPFNYAKRKFVSSCEPDLIPDILQPITYSKKAPRHIYTGMSDGRNTGLVEHLGKLITKLGKESVEEIGRFIHSNIFNEVPEWDVEPMLEQIWDWSSDPTLGVVRSESPLTYKHDASPMNTTHLDRDLGKFKPDVSNYIAGVTELNDKAIDFYEFDKDGNIVSINYYNLAQDIINNYYFYFEGDVPFVYHNGSYISNAEGIAGSGKLLMYSAIKNAIKYTQIIKPNTINSVYSLIETDMAVQLGENPQIRANQSRYISFDNIAYDTKNCEYIEHSPEQYVKYHIPVTLDYQSNPKACLKGNKFIEYMLSLKLSKADVKLLFEYMASTLVPNNSFKSILYVVGASNTGKSILGNCFSHLVGDCNTSATKIEKFESEFGLASLHDKLVNVDPDAKTSKLKDISALKQITGNDAVEVNAKQKTQFKARPICKLVFCCNVVPKQGEEQSNAYYERLRIVRLTNVLKLNQSQVDAIYEDVPKIIPYLLSLNVKDISRSKRSDAEVHKLRQSTDSIYAYLYGRFIFSGDTKADKVPVNKLYGDYVDYCLTMDRFHMQKAQFLDVLQSEHQFILSDGSKQRYVLGAKKIGKFYNEE